MRRLPAGKMLHARIAAGELTRADVEAVARRLVRFYAKAPPQWRDGYKYLQRLVVEGGINRDVLLDPALGLAGLATRRILDAVDNSVENHELEIRWRIAAGYVVEGHGDLRPEHICVLQPPLIFDCLEFDRSMRLVDPYDEISFLGMECRMLGASWVRPLLLSVLRKHLGHSPSRTLLATYTAFRATLRARLCLAHLLDPHPTHPELWQTKARRYLAIAARETAKAPGV
jgi:aminoglycoside phosphotransferase family enzyme